VSLPPMKKRHTTVGGGNPRRELVVYANLQRARARNRVRGHGTKAPSCFSSGGWWAPEVDGPMSPAFPVRWMLVSRCSGGQVPVSSSKPDAYGVLRHVPRPWTPHSPTRSGPMRKVVEGWGPSPRWTFEEKGWPRRCWFIARALSPRRKPLGRWPANRSRRDMMSEGRFRANWDGASLVTLGGEEARGRS